MGPQSPVWLPVPARIQAEACCCCRQASRPRTEEYSFDELVCWPAMVILAATLLALTLLALISVALISVAGLILNRAAWFWQKRTIDGFTSWPAVLATMTRAEFGRIRQSTGFATAPFAFLGECRRNPLSGRTRALTPQSLSIKQLGEAVVVIRVLEKHSSRPECVSSLVASHPPNYSPLSPAKEAGP